ncbi:MAG TPA: methylmalonyl-CoA mutase family protein [Mycobacteriales bacterium]|jgi:methylmalonyl-CoA mutase|nr:methylmalonyl-CoA mutase family protein [Mycobacteriales bacterium]
MAARPEDLRLAGDFPAATLDQWRTLVGPVLRRSGLDPDTADPVESLLRTTTYDGFDIEPLYPPRPTGRDGRPIGGPWWLLQHIDEPDPAAANRAILTDLEGGVSAVWLCLGAGALPIGGLAQALDGVLLELAPVVLDAGPEYEPAARRLIALLADRGLDPAELQGNLGADPLGFTARTGESAALPLAARLAAEVAASHPRLRTLVVDGLPFHQAGGSDGQELGAALAAGVEYLRALTDAGLSAPKAAAQLDFRYAATADQFLTIAKLRAARRLWSRIGAVVDAPWSARLHAVTSPAMLTRRDPWVNLLRGTVACFAASAGGADAITVLPFDAAIGRSDAFARRLARNTASLLRDEAHIARVLDPAAGSGYVESLTDALAEAAWAWFQEIEAAGGLAAALRSGLVADRLAETAAERLRRIATRSDPITGVSEFPFLNEIPVHRPPLPARPSGGLPRIRYAEPYEALRDRSDAAATRPVVFLATLGPVAAHGARASFATNLWNSGGIETVNPGAVADVAASFRDSGAELACICAAPGLATEDIAQVAKALRAAGARKIWLADKESTVDTVDGYVYPGGDALSVLAETLDLAGVP